MNRVYLGRKKLMKFRIQNISKVDCSWSVVCKDDPSAKKTDKEEKKEDLGVFDITPKDGKLAPGKKLTFTATFVPAKRKKYQGRYIFHIVRIIDQRKW